MTDLGGREDLPQRDEYRQWDAAYVLGALSNDERLEFEQHTARCPGCASAVAELAGMVPLLDCASLTLARERDLSTHQHISTPKQVSGDDPMVAVSGDRRRGSTAAPVRVIGRSRRRVALGAALVAVALTVAALVGGSVLQHKASARAISVPLAPLSASGVRATVRLAAEPWGTRIDVSCSYEAQAARSGAAGWSGPPQSYQLVVTDRAGMTAVAAAWTTGPGTTVWPVGSVTFGVDDIAKITVTGHNVALLQATR